MNSTSKGQFSIDILECPICFTVPSKKELLVFCENGHMTCNSCKNKC